MHEKKVYPSSSKCGFYGNRLASLSDLKLKEWKDTYDELEYFSNMYIDFLIRYKLFPKNYDWPIDSLHNFTRIWEYPYVYHQLSKYLPLNPSVNKRKILDIGSALTFLPFFLTSKGYQVRASDKDPTMKQSFEMIKKNLNFPIIIENLDYTICDCRKMITEHDLCYDAILCISVLEHVEQREQAIREFYRILKPKGILILTVDIKLDALSMALDSDAFFSLKEELCKYFNFLEPDRQIHPLDILKKSNHPKHLTARAYDIERLKIKKSILSRLIKKTERLITGKKYVKDTLTAFGMTLIKK